MGEQEAGLMDRRSLSLPLVALGLSFAFFFNFVMLVSAFFLYLKFFFECFPITMRHHRIKLRVGNSHDSLITRKGFRRPRLLGLTERVVR